MFKVNREKCIACMQCIKDCPAKVISLVEGKAEINNDGCIKCGHCIAICPTFANSTDDYDMNEVIEYNKEDFQIEPEKLLKFIKFRRSIRRFKRKDVEKEKLEKIIEAGRFTQTGRNLQDVNYTVVTDKIMDLKRIVIKCLKNKSDYILENTLEDDKGMRKYGLLWKRMYEKFNEDPDNNDSLFYNAPSLIVVSAASELDGGLASSNMELMVDALGLGTFFCGFMVHVAKDNKEIREFLNIKDDYEIVSVIVIGYPDARYKRTVPRKKPDVTWL